MQLPIDRLPISKSSRHAVLRDYFCDKDAEAVLGGAGWRLSLMWPDGLDRHVDPRLQQGLAWWGGDVTLPTMATARTRKGHVLSALYDSWTLQSWSEWVHASGICPDEHVLILHVDDHRDLASPRLFEENGRWKDPITGSFCDLEDPGSVTAAIESGAIGMGSFLTPFLHGFRQAEVRQLCQPPKVLSTQDFAIELATQRDDLLEPGRSRPAVELAPVARQTGPGRYRVTPDLADWLETLPDQPTVLHIDMDYFNNRYDGDTNWESRLNLFDPPMECILEKIDDLTAALAGSGLGSRLVDIVVAYSPGFFPAEYWEEAADRLIPELERIYGR
ncbi:hypothetical protein H0241_00425 [Mesorhizobium sp. CCANP35]|uniref:Uncharacterized protein n=1 Tax=Mesorhizobium neociceri TaxID=1307853 RepID=A0A838AY24_9HYPH|nr:hypothetical protein [Mesorhizobium neociceri]